MWDDFGEAPAGCSVPTAESAPNTRDRASMISTGGIPRTQPSRSSAMDLAHAEGRVSGSSPGQGELSFHLHGFRQKKKGGFWQVFPGSTGNAWGHADPPARSCPAPLRRAAGSEAGRDRHGGHPWMASSHGQTALRGRRGPGVRPAPPAPPVPGLPRPVPAPALLAGLHAAVLGRQHAWGYPQAAKAASGPGNGLCTGPGCWDRRRTGIPGPVFLIKS